MNVSTVGVVATSVTVWVAIGRVTCLGAIKVRWLTRRPAESTTQHLVACSSTKRHFINPIVVTQNPRNSRIIRNVSLSDNGGSHDLRQPDKLNFIRVCLTKRT